MDRLAPTQRPAGGAAQRQRWHHLLFLHWALPEGTLRPLVPAALEIDGFDGDAYVGLVAFTMTGVRPVWAPALPGLSSFHEVNVRTYVHDGRDPGVYFFSLDAASTLAVLVARSLWHLPYHRARMRLARGDTIEYASERLWPGPRPACCAPRYEPVGAPAAAAPGTLEHFLAERYILYVERRGRLLAGRVHHAPYPLQGARVHGLEESLLAPAGIVRGQGAPLAHYASGVGVEVFGLRRAAV